MNHATKSIALALCLPLAALTAPATNAASEELPMVGGHRDVNGCLPGAGENYSILRKSCLRLFEAAIRLDPRVKNETVVLSAFILFAADKSSGTVEVFLPTIENSFIMTWSSDSRPPHWKSEGLSLFVLNGVYALDDIAGNTLYESAAPQ